MNESELNDELICNLIIEAIDGTIAPDAQVLLERWRKKSAENESTYQQYLNVQVNLDKISERHSYAVNDSWEALDRKLSKFDKIPFETQRFEEAPVTPARTSFLWFKIAAAIMVILSAGYYFIASNRGYVTIDSDKDGITALTLPDGSAVKLNAATAVRYHKTEFNDDRRLELLRGEIFIDVAHKQHSRFSVDLGKVEALDIGTSFNVFRNTQKIAVVVEEGIVALKKRSSNEQILLKKGQLGTYNIQKQALMSLVNNDLNYKAWLDHHFRFTETPLHEVVAQLEKAYHTRIRIAEPELKVRRLTADIDYEQIDSVLAVIAASFQCHVTKDQETYVLSDR